MNTEVQRQKERYLRLHSMKTLSLKAVEHCIKSYEDTNISEEEEECLRSNTLKLYYITQKNPLEDLIFAKYGKL